MSVLISWMIESLMVISAAARLAGSCARELTPMRVDATKSCCLLQAMAKVTGSIPSRWAMAMMAFVLVMELSLMKRAAICCCRCGPLRYSVNLALLGLAPLLYLPVSTPPASGEYGRQLTPSAMHAILSSSSNLRLFTEKLFWMVSARRRPAASASLSHFMRP